MAPAWATLALGVLAFAAGIGFALRANRLGGLAISAGGFLIVALQLAARCAADEAGAGFQFGPSLALFLFAGSAAAATNRAEKIGAGNPLVGELFRALVPLGLIGGLVVGESGPGPGPGPGAAAAAVTFAIFIGSPNPLCRFLAGVAMVRAILGIAALDASWLTRAAGPAILTVAFLELFLRWRARRKAWFDEPERLLQQRGVPGGYFALVWGLALLSGANALRPVPDLTDVLWTSLGAIGLLTFGHLGRSPATGEAGLALAAAALAAFVVCFGFAPALPAGIALAGLWMMWLARFWNQQLRDGTPWTTAGRLIPAARKVGAAAAYAFALVLWISPGLAGFWRTAALILGLALLAALATAARRERCAGSAIGGLAAAVGAALLLEQAISESLPAFLAPAAAALAASLLGAIILTSRNKDGAIARAAWIGIAVVSLAGIALSRPEEPQLFVAASITLLAGLLYGGLARRAGGLVDSQS